MRTITIVSILPVLVAGVARAEGPAPGEHREALFLDRAVTPEIGRQSVWAAVRMGYDSSRGSPVMGTTAEVTLARWLAVRAGVVYLPQDPDNRTARPNLGLRAQVLRQSEHTLSAAVALSYRQERFSEDGGLLEVLLSAGRTTDRAVLFGNVSYAQDPEGDDFEAELRAAALYRLLPPLSVGLQANFRKDLGSTDSRRLTRVQPDYEYVAGPVATYSLSNWMLFVHGGVSGMNHPERETGALGLAGLGVIF